MITETEIAKMGTMMTATAPPLMVMDGVGTGTEEEMCST